MKCIFCIENLKDVEKIIQNENFVVIKDKYQPRDHFLCLPTIHMENLLTKQLKRRNIFLNSFFSNLDSIIEKLNLKNGYTLKINNITNQEILHLHIHLYNHN